MKYGILVVEDNQLNRELLCDWLDGELVNLLERVVPGANTLTEENLERMSRA